MKQVEVKLKLVADYAGEPSLQDISDLVVSVNEVLEQADMDRQPQLVLETPLQVEVTGEEELDG